VNIRIRFLRQPDAFREALRKDGWTVRAEPDNEVSVEHTEVPDEISARNRLQQLGLLTSPSLAIDFHSSRFKSNRM